MSKETNQQNSGIIEIFQSLQTQRWYFRVKAINGQVIVSSGPYRSKAGVKIGINALKKAMKNPGLISPL